MTACVNKKHSRRVAAAVSASLVGALTLGAAPAVVMAEEAPVDQQVQESGEAFTNGFVQAAFHYGTSTVNYAGNKNVPATVEFVKNQAMVLDEVYVKVKVADKTVNYTIAGDQEDQEYSVKYYNRGTDGKNTGKEITGDINKVGKYVAVVTAGPESDYPGGVVYVPFDITARQLTNVYMELNSGVYDATEKKATFFIDANGDHTLNTGEQVLIEGTDYTVKYYEAGHGTTSQYERDLVDAGDYNAVVTAVENSGYEGTVTLTGTIHISELDLKDVYIEPVVTTSDEEPTQPAAIWISGHRYGEGSAILSEIADHNTDATGSYLAESAYLYQATPAKADDTNFVQPDSDPAEGESGVKNLNVYRVAEIADFYYDGQAWADYYETFVKSPETKWDSSKVTAKLDNGTVVPVTKLRVFNEKGQDCSTINWSQTPGTYTLVYWIAPADMTVSGDTYRAGGVATTTLKVWDQAINADASVQVGYDKDDDDEFEVVTSIEKTYDGVDLLDPADLNDGIRVVVTDKDGNNVTSKCSIKYYDANGKEVREIKNAGTYTMKITSDVYKLSGTTEVPITVAKLDASTVKVGAETTTDFDETNASISYVPWRKSGYGLTLLNNVVWGLDLQYLEADGKTWAPLPMDVFKVTITDAEGEELQKVVDEGVYTLHFEGRNADAQNNYVCPADISFTVIKDGTDWKGDPTDDVVNHVKFSDVRWNDYFADAVDYVSDKDWMNGYKNRAVFGSLDSLSRGQVASVLYNMAGGLSLKVEGSYSDLWGYDTGFSDVDGKAYYARAIAWAKQSGVVNGYADGTFHPDQAVTRQEFACMLANYAKKYGTYKAASAVALDKMSDAEQVADFAVDSVAWAVENGILGNSGYVAAGSTIIRADAACMVYNYAK